MTNRQYEKPPPFDPEVATVLDVVAAHPATQDVFRGYDAAAGCCLLCQGLFETVGGLAARFGLDRDALVHDLTMAINKENP
ncbi:hypothetical protein DesfrDRAFT_0225 [Solidesulfovibrio fructosivorans JJ]]|uniref:DUF1858 domain-containing protein n=1 Tax=Solidesulfovibrio fructosivorans JJ] TaxID=596151 RepID=E1JRH6_SOLFR|nr:hypothetical protein [Solidesulfovibrio fructosivorans]EFL53177.1 hypothetical protein DesfrDRAFT_0225 [Solidesulfovibrio fructosivorans JJ]]